MARRIVLHSTLTPAVLATKLRDVLGDRTAAAAVAGVTGDGSETEMLLFVYRPNVRNSFATRLSAKMSAEGGGTRIEGTIGVAGGAKGFMIFWFAFLALFIALPVTGMISTHEPIGNILPFVAIPGGMMAFGGLLWRIGTMNGKKDEAAILDFLAVTVSATPA